MAYTIIYISPVSVNKWETAHNQLSFGLGSAIGSDYVSLQLRPI